MTQVLNETTSGTLAAAQATSVIRNPRSMDELTSYLGKYKKAHVLLDDMNSELNYMRRDRAEYLALRDNPTILYALTSLNHFQTTPDALATFEPNDLMKLATGKVPSGSAGSIGRSLLMMVAQTLIDNRTIIQWIHHTIQHCRKHNPSLRRIYRIIQAPKFYGHRRTVLSTR